MHSDAGAAGSGTVSEPSQLDRLETLLERETVSRMAAIFITEWRRQAPLLKAEALVPTGNMDGQGRRAAHDLVTNAGSLGFMQLSEAARQFEAAVATGAQSATLDAWRIVEPLANEAARILAVRYGPFSS
jgi:HPt (histidine-containing phosphotransfer) domain-containing protein